MAISTATRGGRRLSPWRILGWSTAGLLLLVPWLANAPWTASDYVFAGVMFGSVGLAFELVVRKSSILAYRLAAATAVVAAFLTVWVNAAVGMIGSEGNPYNLLFGGVLLIALIGAIVARFEARGTMCAMAAAATAQAIISAVGLSTDPLGAKFSMAFAAPWLLAAALFGSAAPSATARGPASGEP